jgi:polygalacturonase
LPRLRATLNPIEITGTYIIITGASGHIIDGNGPNYWDGQGPNGGQAKWVHSHTFYTANYYTNFECRPDHVILATEVINSKITNLNIQNWPLQCFDITKCDGLEISGLTLDNSAGYASNPISSGLPAVHNSDGIDLLSTSNALLTNTTVINQDDCVAVTSGSNITVSQMHCSGGHGLRIGSVGGKSNNTVVVITFLDSVVNNSENGCRIETNSGTTGQVSLT